eukprot:588907-Pelagomonas_calceolata.AAC.1
MMGKAKDDEELEGSARVAYLNAAVAARGLQATGSVLGTRGKQGKEDRKSIGQWGVGLQRQTGKGEDRSSIGQWGAGLQRLCGLADLNATIAATVSSMRLAALLQAAKVCTQGATVTTVRGYNPLEENSNSRLCVKSKGEGFDSHPFLALRECESRCSGDLKHGPVDFWDCAQNSWACPAPSGALRLGPPSELQTRAIKGHQGQLRATKGYQVSFRPGPSLPNEQT